MTLKEIAQHLGISVHTVSDVLNCGDMRYSEATRKRIYEGAERLGYRVNRQARILRGGKSGMIGIIKTVDLIQAPAERALFAGEAIHNAGYEILLNNALWHQDGLARAVDTMLAARVEGVLLAGLPQGSEAQAPVKQLLKARIPLVTMGGGRIPGIPHVSPDFYQGGCLMAEHLLSLGYQRFATLVPQWATPTSSAGRRLAGLKDTIARAGLGERAISVVEVKHPLGALESAAAYEYMPGKVGMQKILKRKRLPEAIISNDYYAIAAIQACVEAGLKVPDDIAVAGFDNTANGQFATPALTSISQLVKQIAERAVYLLLEQIQAGEPAKGELLEELPCELVVRESCGARTRRENAGAGAHAT